MVQNAGTGNLSSIWPPWISITFLSRSASDIPDKVSLDILEIIILDDTTHHVSTLESLADSVLLTKFLPTVLASSEATLGCR